MRSCKQGMARRLTSIISNRRRLRHGAEMAVYGGEIVQEILLEDLAGREADFYCDIFQVVEDISAHTHDFLEVAYILEGTLVHSAGGIPAPPGRGSILSLIMGFPMSTAVPWTGQGIQLSFPPGFSGQHPAFQPGHGRRAAEPLAPREAGIPVRALQRRRIHRSGRAGAA